MRNTIKINQTIFLDGVPSAELTGVPNIVFDQTVFLSGVQSGEITGVPTVAPPAAAADRPVTISLQGSIYTVDTNASIHTISSSAGGLYTIGMHMD